MELAFQNKPEVLRTALDESSPDVIIAPADATAAIERFIRQQADHVGAPPLQEQA